mmetsp:Transcript_71221/g.123668  ORF Transcript_71221/g.123668 Transcript_71221/m.123668 type:complete len:465 (-) Transcript_71221:109-1503(-)
MMCLRLTVLSAVLVAPISALPIHSARRQLSGQRQHTKRAGTQALPLRPGLLQGRGSRQTPRRSELCELRCQAAGSAAKSAVNSTAESSCADQCHKTWASLHQASNFVKAGRATLIQFPDSSEVQKLRVGNNTAFDGVMFAGGLLVNGRSSFTARLCTSQCKDNHAAGLTSTVILGELNWEDVKRRRTEVRWASASEVSVPHITTGAYVGPEDPRLDVIQGARFVLANINVDEPGCPKFIPEWSNPRRMFFKPLDPIPDAQPCAIQLEEVDRCSVQKNWASLVPRGSNEIFFVYSTMPFRILQFDKQRCKASFVRDEATAADLSAAHSNASLIKGLEKVHGGSRYVFGIAVPEGELYFALGHTAPPDYRQVLIAVLRRLGTHGTSFSLAAVSCPIKISLHDRGSSLRSKTIATSIVEFNNETDRTRITYQMNDEKNYITELEGVGKWLRAIHEEFHSGLPLHCTG